MQHGALLAGVDDLSREHSVALRFHAGFAGQLQQGRPDGAVKRLAREVDADAGAIGGGLHRIAVGLGQSLAEVRLGQGGELGELLPGGEGGGAGAVHLLCL